ncbi:unnamed protein product [Bursaphelenchus xylophilus]|uniref:(pine wood nematode) hypothetical protein n=1 Tax=Bursaphelenchus xylophilus TaxID=6326 RepID=A0A1I7RLS0_BURXY|nr:unnamed protein product [Bursaphelenchus xylophilus]CAG9106321.1 unnamed protein product [Bursaphelenchus xylophilus]
MVCSIIRLNSLSTIWYTILMLLLQSYLLYLAIHRYRLYTEIKWPNNEYPRAWLTVYISLCGACIPLMVLMGLFGIFKTGNLAGDNKKLRWTEKDDKRKREKGCFLFSAIRSSWIHAPPLPQTLHVLTAIVQLVAQQIMLAQLYRFGFINSGDLLNTELDFLYQRSRQLATNLPMGDTRLQGFRITSDELTGSPLAPRLLPILMHARLFGIPLEFVNLFIALIVYAAVYPSVFWKLNKWFSFWFSLQLIVHSADIIYTYLGFSILYRIQETNTYSRRPIGIGQHLAVASQLAIYLPTVILGTFVGTIILMMIAPVIVYAYGYNKYYTTVKAKYEADAPISKQNAPNVGLLDDFDGGRQKDSYTLPSLCCDGYGPHVTAIFLLVFLVIIKAPTIYALLLLYQHDEKPFLLSTLIVEITYLFSWILLWLLFTCKREWKFNLPPRSMYSPRPPVLVSNYRPPEPTNLFSGTYQRNQYEKNSPTSYHPESYASIRRPIRPAGLMYAQNLTESSNDYATKPIDYGKVGSMNTNTTNASYGSYTIGRNSTINYESGYGTYGMSNGSPKSNNNYAPNQQKLQISGNSVTKPIISGANYTAKPNWEQNNGTYGKLEKAHDPAALPPPATMTPSSTLTSQNSNTSSFQNNGNTQSGQLTTLLMKHGSTSTLTQLDPNAQFATSVV